LLKEIGEKIMKKIALGILGTLIVLMMLPMFRVPTVYAQGEQTDTPPAGYTPIPVTEIAGCDKLIVEDLYPWAAGPPRPDPDRLACDELGYAWGVITSNTLLTQALVGADGRPLWKAVILVSDQDQTYYNNLVAAAAKLAGYVSAGGVLVAHCCDWAWNGGNWDGMSFLPGGVTKTWEYGSLLTILLPGDPIVAGVTDAGIDNWFHSYHGYFNPSSLPVGTTVIIAVTGFELDKPVYIEYRWGNGLVKANMMTLEHCRVFDGIENQHPEGWTLLKNGIRQAQEWGIPEFGLPTFAVTSVLFAAMAVFLTRKRRLLIKA